jgi:hypothetical protein
MIDQGLLQADELAHVHFAESLAEIKELLCDKAETFTGKPS